MATEISALDKQGLATTWDRTKAYVNDRLAGVATTFDYEEVYVGDIKRPVLTVAQGGTGADNPLDAIINLEGLEIYKVWNNPDVSQTYESKSEVIDKEILQEYSLFIMFFNTSTSSPKKTFGMNVPQTYGDAQLILNISSNSPILFTSRDWFVDANGGKLTFGDCYTKDASNQQTTNNQYLIPYRLYGIKRVRD